VIPLPNLPILEALPALRAALLRDRSVVLEAPPGAGKSTVVPLAILDEPWVGSRKILMLEPRRLAARAVAERMASTLGERVGETVGYRMRLDTRVGPRTRIEVVTEGVLTRMLQHDASLDGIAAVIFDEFHERSIQADLGLAFCLDVRATLELDLRLIVMSATLDGIAIAALMNDAPVVTSAGRMFDVEKRYVGKGFPVLPGDVDSPERLTASAVQRALRECDGDVLVFLPGAREIRRVQQILLDTEECKRQGVDIFPLYGELTKGEQDAALTDDPAAPRRVILATNIAETSLTLPRIRIVVDSGLVRRAIFDPVSGMTRLETRRISRASADQRAGRAGRVARGVCYRLWSEGAQRSLAAHSAAEILEADLVPLALELAAWGTADANTLRWLDAPPVAMLASARDLLRQLGALDERGQPTAHGRELTEWPVHPRLAHLLLEAGQRGEERLGARMAALLGERDLLLRSLAGTRSAHAEFSDADISTRLDIFEDHATGGIAVDRSALARARRIAEQLERRLTNRFVDKKFPYAPSLDAAGLLACAYPDRIGRRRVGGEGRYLLANGRGASFAKADRLARNEFIVAIDLDDRDREARILMASALSWSMLELAAGHRIVNEREVRWSSGSESIVARDVVRLDALILNEKPLQSIPSERAVPAMIEGIRAMGLGCLPWDDDTRTFQARVELARRWRIRDAQSWPGFDDAILLDTLEEWLEPWLEGVTRRTHLTRIPLMEALRYRLGSVAARDLDVWLPTHLIVPTGSRIRIDYLDDLAPCAAMRMQEVFGMASTPKVGDGHVPLTFKLLSPAQRPLQVTSDLASFWRNAYSDVRKDMRGRYPRHYWPEDPLQAEPTRRVRPRS